MSISKVSRVICIGVLTGLVTIPLQESQGQTKATVDSLSKRIDRAVRVYLDCQFCDRTYLRQNLKFVDHVRNRQQADVHVLVTAQATGGGGRSYELEFIGRGPFKGSHFELPYNTPPTDTDDERRKGLAERLRIGLGPFVSRSPNASGVSLRYETSNEKQSAPSHAKDPWNQWVFEIGVSGRSHIEDQVQGYNFRGNVEATRITQEWKLDFVSNIQYELDIFEPKGGEKVRSSSQLRAVSGNVVKTLGPHWGAGVSESTFSRTETNHELAIRSQAALEYNVFPYKVSDEKELTITYRIGPEYSKYDQTTIFGHNTQLLTKHSLEVSLDLNQPWGSIYSEIQISHYFHDFGRNRLSSHTGLQLQVVEGFSFDLSFTAERIQDQIYLPAGDLSEEEIFLRRRELSTNYSLSGSIGLSYTFGSIYNNVVNTRI